MYRQVDQQGLCKNIDFLLRSLVTYNTHHQHPSPFAANPACLMQLLRECGQASWILQAFLGTKSTVVNELYKHINAF